MATSAGWTALHLAAGAGHLATVQYLFTEAGLDITKVDKNGETAIQYASQGGHLDIVKFLYDQAGIGVNVAGGYKIMIENITHLIDAVNQNNLELVKSICSEQGAGASLVCKGVGERQKTALHIASWKGYTEIVEYFFTLPLDDVHVNITDSTGWTAVHYAASGGHLDTVKFLCNQPGFYVNKGDEDGDTALNCAASSGHLDTVKFLCDQPGVDVNKVGDRNQTPLHFAAKNGYLDIVKLLCDKADIDFNKGDIDDNTALHLALSNRHTKTVTFLCSQAGVNINKTNKHGQTALHLAASSEHLDTTKLLCEQIDVDLDKVDNKGWTPLHHASRSGQTDTVNFLSGKNRLSVDRTDNQGMTVLHLAAVGGHTKTIKFFCGQNLVDVNKSDDSGQTALHHSARNGNEHTVKFLCTQAEVSINMIDNDGRTALNGAATEGHVNTVRLLCTQNGVDINKGDNNNDTALHKASANGHTSTVQLLCNQDRIDINKTNNKGITPLSRAIQSANIAAATVLLSQLTIDVDMKDNDDKGILQHILSISSCVNKVEKDVTVTKWLKEKYLTNGIISAELPEALKELLDVEDLPVLEFLKNNASNLDLSDDLRQFLSAILNVIIISLQKYADHESLRYAFFKEHVYKTLIQIFVDSPESKVGDTGYIIQILKLLYVSLQANNTCAKTEKEFLRTSFDQNLLVKFKEKIRQLASISTTEKCSDVQLLAMNIENVYIKKETGCFSKMKHFFANCDEQVSQCLNKCLSKCLSKCLNNVPINIFHKCSTRGCFAIILCIIGIYIHVSDIIFDAIVGFRTLWGFSKRLGILIITLVFFTLIHENIRSCIELYKAEEEVLRVKLGRFQLKQKDWEDESELNYSSKPIKKRIFQIFWPFKLKDGLKCKAVVFNLLSFFMLRPIVDRLVVLVHSPTSLRTVYRQMSKQKSLNQYFMIIEQMPELLIQFYIFQILYNNINEKYQPGCLISGNNVNNSFQYDSVHFDCTPNFLGIKTCATWILIYSIAVPFFKIPASMVSLEGMFRKLDPLTPKMSSGAYYMLYLTYIMMIPSRLFLFSGMMHAVPNHFIVTGYIILTSFIWWLINGITNKDNILKRLNKSSGCKLVIKIIKESWILYLFSFRDVLVISLRGSNAYMSKPSEVSYDSLRDWKKLVIIITVYFIEGLIGALYIEHSYPCGMRSEVFKYQGWLWLVLLIFSSALLILLSRVLQPQLINIIPKEFPRICIMVGSFGLAMFFFAVLIFIAPIKFMVKITMIVLLTIFLMLGALVFLILKHFGEAKKKKDEELGIQDEDTNRSEEICTCCPIFCCRTEMDHGAETGPDYQRLAHTDNTQV